jgi:4-carboxymuconolactone decarboxylase
MDQEAYDRGLKLRRQVMGDDFVDRAMASQDELNKAIQDVIVEYGLGNSWGRGGLELKTRSFINLGMLAALRKEHEFRGHFRGAIRNGATLEELKQVLIQIAIYCGVPAAVEAFRIARPVLEEERKAGNLKG